MKGKINKVKEEFFSKSISQASIDTKCKKYKENLNYFEKQVEIYKQRAKDGHKISESLMKRKEENINKNKSITGGNLRIYGRRVGDGVDEGGVARGK